MKPIKLKRPCKECGEIERLNEHDNCAPCQESLEYRVRNFDPLGLSQYKKNRLSDVTLNHPPDVKAVLDITNKLLNDWLEDLDSGMRQDEAQFQMDSAVISNATPLILAAPKLLNFIERMRYHPTQMTIKEWRDEVDELLQLAATTKFEDAETIKAAIKIKKQRKNRVRKNQYE